MNRLEEEMTAAGQGDRFRRFQPYLVADAAPSYKELAAELGVSESAVKVTVHRMRKRYGALLREEVAETVAGPERVDRLTFARALAPLAGVDPATLQGGTGADQPGRPADVSLDSSRAAALLDTEIVGLP